MRHSRVFLLAALIPLAAGIVGCVEREFWIVTDPPGVRVFIDGEEMKDVEGNSESQPLVDDPAEPDEMRATRRRQLGLMRIPFDRYATREIVLTRDGYETQTHYISPDQELWEHFPFDVFTEVLLPATIHKRFVFRFTLEEREAATIESTRRRADEARDAAGGKLAEAREKNDIAPPEPRER